MSQVVEHLPSKLEALSSILNTKKKKKKRFKKWEKHGIYDYSQM
jgi:hypothetical protein